MDLNDKGEHMGRIYNKYKKQYLDEIYYPNKDKKDIAIVKPNIWITMKYLDDNNLEPWEDEFIRLFTQLEIEDKEMFYCIAETIMDFHQHCSNKKFN